MLHHRNVTVLALLVVDAVLAGDTAAHAGAHAVVLRAQAGVLLAQVLDLVLQLPQLLLRGDLRGE